MKTLTGGCHCQTVRFEIEVEEQPYLTDCNCSMCTKTGFIHLIIPKQQFNLLSGEHDLQLYRFNSKVAKHYFCKHCGVESFYIPRSNPDGYSVNARCLDTDDWQNWPIDKFDGQNWQQNAAKLSHLSK
ncbi:GFA family protein [Thalassotalea sp. Y01]|uniref:GFA family protein n=1 Tax=Thalassotalea sp. Y01 TaxID=2729613 RepID=UPI00145E02A9|nr:GFA family protein [Thalassotalea sp. Y01]NMP16744.1 GFA family protein [Thalassotalea sp. Y01]